MSRPRPSQPGPYLKSVALLRDKIPPAAAYPFDLPAIASLNHLDFDRRVTFFVGENGAGKSTLLEAIAVLMRLNPEGGSRNFNFATRPSHSELWRALRLSREPNMPRDVYFLRAESFYNVATEIERLGVSGGYGERSLHEQSHGESFVSFFENRLRAHGLYLMDEPEAALSPRRQLQFLRILHDFVQTGSQFVIATHSPMLLAYPQATIYRFDDNGIERVRYEETDHYLIVRGFLASPRQTLEELFGDH